MSWFKSKSEPPAIPKYGQQQPQQIRAPAPREEPMVVEEERNPSDSMILRFIKKLKGEGEE
jgi:hypothetical protein